MRTKRSCSAVRLSLAQAAAVVTLVGAFWLAAPAAARDSFETLEPSWQLAWKDCDVVIAAHQRTLEQAHSGQASEYLRLQCGHGTRVYLVQPIEPAYVIDELKPTVWIRSDRPGIELLARVVLPNSLDPNTGAPMTTLVPGTRYSAVGTWQQLQVFSLAQQLRRQLWFLRRKFGPQVNMRQAYVDHLVLNVYSGPGPVQVWIDDLEVEGRVALTAAMIGQPRQWRPKGSFGLSGGSVPGAAVALDGSVLKADRRPMFVRLIQYSGEPLAFLRRLGFNAVLLPAPPTTEQLAEAEQTGIWLVAPLPDAEPAGGLAEPALPVLAWSLGEDLSSNELAQTRKRIAAARTNPRLAKRPLVCGASGSLWQYSRNADILLLGKHVAGTALARGSYTRWLQGRMRLAEPATPVWAAVPTQLPEGMVSQARLLGGEPTLTLPLEPDRVRLLVYEALAAGVRGICFLSRSRLDRQDAATQLRAANLHLINLELSALQPWAAAGSPFGPLATSDPAVTVYGLKTDRSRLLVALRRPTRPSATNAARRAVSFVDSGAPQSSRAYQFTITGGLHPVDHLCRAGLHVTLTDPEPISVIVATQDPLVVDHLAGGPQQVRQEAAQLQLKTTSAWLSILRQLTQQVEAAGGLPETDVLIDQAGQYLDRCRQVLPSGDTQAAAAYAQRAMGLLRALAEQLRQATAAADGPLLASRPAEGLLSLPMRQQLARRLRSARWSSNLLAGGHFEDLQTMHAAGWRHLRSSDPQILTRVQLVALEPGSRNHALHLRSWLADPAARAPVIEEPPIRIVSPPIAVRRGQLVCIHGWVKLNEAAAAGGGLLLYDSIGGLELARRIRVPDQWQEITVYRVAPAAGVLTITWDLDSLGEAWLDAFEVLVSASDAESELALKRAEAFRSSGLR